MSKAFKTGRCHCGNIQYQITGDTVWTSYQLAWGEESLKNNHPHAIIGYVRNPSIAPSLVIHLPCSAARSVGILAHRSPPSLHPSDGTQRLA